MKLPVADLERQAIDLDESLAHGSIDFVEDMRRVGTVPAQMSCVFTEEHAWRLHL